MFIALRSHECILYIDFRGTINIAKATKRSYINLSFVQLNNKKSYLETFKQLRIARLRPKIKQTIKSPLGGN